MFKSSKSYEYLILSFLSLVSLIGIFLFNGVGLEADSFHHHLIARFAFDHPYLFLDHWGKPIYTILSSPFAYFGFKGTQIFNWLCTIGIFYLLFSISKTLNLKHPILASILFFLFPISITTSYFGFTEPLAALFIMLSISFILKEKYVLAAILISFTPFIRSEGLIFIGVFGLFFAYIKNWRALLYLSIGHVFFILIGFIFFKENILWVFNKIPYASLDSHYGNGTLIHFGEKLIYLLGIPALIFFLIGLFSIPFHSGKFKNEIILIYSIFLIFFIAHSLFWYLGIFNSMGLERVFAAVSPLMAIVALYGFNSSIDRIPNKKTKLLATTIVLTYIIVFPFTSNPAAVDWQKDLNLSPPQKMAEEVGIYLVNSEFSERRFIYTNTYLAKPLNIDPYDKGRRMILAPSTLSLVKDGDIIIWDNWHSVVDYGLSLESLEKDPRFKPIKVFESESYEDLVKYVVFEVSVIH